MPVYNLHAVDGTAIDPDTGEIVLLISDNLTWDDERLHLGIIEAKLNRYFQFVSAGQHLELYPDAADRKLRIDCLCEHAPPPSTDWFVEEARKAARQLDIDFALKAAPEAGSGRNDASQRA